MILPNCRQKQVFTFKAGWAKPKMFGRLGGVNAFST